MDFTANITSAVFITGNSRTGTSMVSKILGNNELIYGFKELHFFEQLWYPEKNAGRLTKEQAVKLFAELISLQRQGFYANRTPEKFYEEARNYFQSSGYETITAPLVFMNYLLYESKLHKKQIPCEQTPRNLFFIDEILSFYPNAKIVCMMRDPRDVLLSQKYKWKLRFLGYKRMPMKEMVRSWFNYHPITISKLWNSSAKQVATSIAKKNVHLLKFEELLENPEQKLKELCNFLNVEFQQSMLLIPKIGSSIVHDQKGLGIDKNRTGHFLKELTSTEIYLCQKITAQHRKQFGYDDAQVRPIFLILIVSWISFPIKLFFALLLNISRSKNLLSSIRRRLVLKSVN
jgi:omega-hydroxy-beta-dihydromenaquinone-9 sulfotransferase